jgi:hypothetical protein
MNPETGKMEAVAGTTYDGIDVFAPYKLTLTFCDAYRDDFYSWGFDVQINKNRAGKSRPFYVLRLGRLCLTGGWLFEEDVFRSPRLEAQRESQEEL